ncbi:Putative callose synthase 8 [Striga hermonthica]|uniref:Callose synthase 8 n=1 Tax=Striga hermonthica TaxID=68872 RepID=A0A9N7MN56_STRHE|nr:Putative callose synthase 8 [Striga hermonthica]
MPECLCYIFHHMASELHGMLTGAVSLTTGEIVKPAYGGKSEAFLTDVVSPIYEVIRQEAMKNRDGTTDHSTWRNYDDLNEFFWSPECFELGWPMNSNHDFFFVDTSKDDKEKKTPTPNRNTREEDNDENVRDVEMGANVVKPQEPKWLGKTNFSEIRSFWQVFRSFDRMWSFLILSLQAMIIMASHELDSPLKLLDTTVLEDVMSIFITSAVGLLYFLSCFWGFYPVFEAIFTFPQERTMLEKERSSGTYRLSSFFMALTLGDLPTVLVLPTAFYTAVYWMAGLKPRPGPFLSGLAVTLYGVLCAQGLGLVIGALVMDAKSANALASVVVLVFQLTSGFYVQRMPGFIGWIRYGSIMQYTYKLYLGTQYGPGQTYPCGPGRVCHVADFPAVQAVGLGGKGVCVAALGLMLVGYRVVAYVALMRIGVTGK